jgi:hypothetical protein
MNHYLIEQDLIHLELVVKRIGWNQGLSLSYWRKRVDEMLANGLTRQQRDRALRLDATVAALEKLETGVLRQVA